MLRRVIGKDARQLANCIPYCELSNNSDLSYARLAPKGIDSPGSAKAIELDFFLGW